MGPSPILSVIHTIPIGTVLNCNGGSNGHRLKNLHVNSPVHEHFVTAWNLRNQRNGHRHELLQNLTKSRDLPFPLK